MRGPAGGTVERPPEIIPPASGVSVAVIRAGRDTLVYRGYGLADVENEAAATPLTVYRIGSVTKQFTAAAVLRLVDEKRVELDAPVSRYVPRLRDAWSGIRVRHLLNHTAGIPDFRERWLTLDLREDALTPDSVIGIVRNEPLEFAPGTQGSTAASGTSCWACSSSG
ncbi:MAG TPA: serine hydrolase domain-containing protein [Longimicrobium sp.]|nr:serine hydrolase domain-containing protein [Longimicrobium sp.]